MNTQQTMIDEWLAANGGPRRFPAGYTVRTDEVREYLEQNGYQTKKRAGWYYVTIDGKSKRMDWKALIMFADVLRIKDGKEPIIKRGSN